MEITTLIGVILSFVFVIIGIYWGGGDITAFADPASIMITIGGTVSGLIASFSLKEFMSFPKVMGVTFKKNEYDSVNCINTIVSLATIARKEGMLALDEQANSLEDAFLKKGIMLVVDGTDPDLVKNIMEAEISSIESRHGRGQGMMDMVSTLGPAYGMLGTLIGLIIMLGNLSDPSALGGGMSAALITTFYGSAIANMFAIPMLNKMKTASGQEILYKEIMLEGLLSIQAGENPRIIEEKLFSFLPTSVREAEQEKSEEEE